MLIILHFAHKLPYLFIFPFCLAFYILIHLIVKFICVIICVFMYYFPLSSAPLFPQTYLFLHFLLHLYIRIHFHLIKPMKRASFCVTWVSAFHLLIYQHQSSQINYYSLLQQRKSGDKEGKNVYFWKLPGTGKSRRTTWCQSFCERRPRSQ